MKCTKNMEKIMDSVIKKAMNGKRELSQVDFANFLKNNPLELAKIENTAIVKNLMSNGLLF